MWKGNPMTDTNKALEAFFQKYGRQPHHSFEMAATKFLEITDPDYVPRRA
jgi:hypothetical protein